MEYHLTTDDQQWLEEIWGNIRKKMAVECERIGTDIPFEAENGKYIDMGKQDIYWWTNGFWPGMLWQMYHATGEELYRTTSEGVEARLDEALEGFEGLHHDVGFMWLHSAVANYRITGNEKSKIRGLHAASLLAGRYNPLGQFIRAWNSHSGNDCTGWIIIDCMMNIPLLYWASREVNDPRFKAIAIHHADTVLKTTIRGDGSSNHIVMLDPENGEFIDNPGGQGFDSGSSWSRGQAWAVYGMALSYKHTGKTEYLDAAKQVAHYFIANVAETGYIPLVDFRAPAEPVCYDTTAGVCAACGLLEIAGHVSEYEKPLYIRSAIKILQATERKYCNWNPEEDSIVSGGTGAYHSEIKEIPIIYGDYFFIEAVLRLMDKDIFIW
jgi:unsaturated chondroitin disaccharide hydrolase